MAVTKLNYSWEHICKAAAGGVQSSTKQWKVDNCGAACENSVHTHTHTHCAAVVGTLKALLHRFVGICPIWSFWNQIWFKVVLSIAWLSSLSLRLSQKVLYLSFCWSDEIPMS